MCMVLCLHVCHLSSALGSHSDPLTLELETVVNYQLGAGNLRAASALHC